MKRTIPIPLHQHGSAPTGVTGLLLHLKIMGSQVNHEPILAEPGDEAICRSFYSANIRAEILPASILFWTRGVRPEFSSARFCWHWARAENRGYGFFGRLALALRERGLGVEWSDMASQVG
jgi:hypothetical protein